MMGKSPVRQHSSAKICSVDHPYIFRALLHHVNVGLVDTKRASQDIKLLLTIYQGISRYNQRGITRQ